MSRLIDADSLLEALHETFLKYGEDTEFTKGIDFAMELVNEQTTFDVSDLKEIFEIVMPVVRDCYEAVLPIAKEQLARPQGEWVNPTKNTDFCNRDLFSDCSICGHTQMDETNFCPNCGADLRGGVEE